MTTLMPQRIPLSQIVLDPTPSRSYIDPEKLASLAENMRAQGQQNPIKVRARSDGKFEIIAGNRRFLAAQKIEWTEIDAVVFPESTTAAQTEVISLIDDVQREDLNPLDEARVYQRLLSAHNMTQEQVATAVGKTRPVIAGMLVLLTMPSEVQDAVSRETLSPGHVRFLSRIGDKREILRLARLAVSKGWAVRELEKRVNKKLKKPLTEPPVKASEIDPLGPLWAQHKGSITVPDGAWNVAYTKGGWFFSVRPGKTAAAAAIATWAETLAKALRSSEAKTIDASPKLAQFAQDFTAAVANTPEDAALVDDPARARLPKSDEDWASFLQAVAESPSAMYRWIYGAKSDLARTSEGVTWKAMGVANPEKTAREIVAAIEEM
jgi:ParB family transcriptional regulator, chromosome partitioning protein